MKSRYAVSVVLSLALATLAAGAQRGAAPHAGMAASSGGGARGGFAPSAHAGFAPSAARGGPAPAARFGSAAGTRTAVGERSLFPPPGITSTRPVFYSNGIRRYGEAGGRGQRYAGAGYGGVGYGLIGYGYPGYLDFGYPGDDALDPLDPNNGNTGTSAQDAFVNAPAASAYGLDSNAGVPPAYAAESEPTPYVTPPEPPAPYSAPRRAQPAPLPEEDAVTIIFKDGRPPEQIHNYALTRTTLYITTGRVRAVPVEDIDLPATEKANQKAGVEFQLPTK